MSQNVTLAAKIRRRTIRKDDSIAAARHENKKDERKKRGKDRVWALDMLVVYATIGS